MRLECAHRHGDCKIGFAGACRTNAKDNRVVSDRINVGLLSQRLGANRTPLRSEQNKIAGQLTHPRLVP